MMEICVQGIMEVTVKVFTNMSWNRALELNHKLNTLWSIKTRNGWRKNCSATLAIVGVRKRS